MAGLVAYDFVFFWLHVGMHLLPRVGRAVGHSQHHGFDGRPRNWPRDAGGMPGGGGVGGGADGGGFSGEGGGNGAGEGGGEATAAGVTVVVFSSGALAWIQVR